MAEHSPLPWSIQGPVSASHGPEWEISTENGHGIWTARCQSVADAEFIVRAVNSHDALVTYARKVLEGFGKDIFGRNTANDHESDWAIKALPYVSALAHLEATLKQLQAQAEGQ